MTNAAKPRSTLSGDNHHRSVRSVRCWMCARVGEKTPDAGRFAVGALINCSSSNGLLVEEYTETALRFSAGLNCQDLLWRPTPSSSTSRQNSLSYWVSGMAIFSPDCCTVARAESNSETS